jgi:hypothetical protein
MFFSDLLVYPKPRLPTSTTNDNAKVSAVLMFTAVSPGFDVASRGQPFHSN